MKTIIAYLFISHGRRHSRTVSELPGARTQVNALTDLAGRSDAKLRVLAHDYARLIRDADDLENLFRVLDTLRETHTEKGAAPVLVIDDYCRLFRAASPEYRSQLWVDLLEYSHVLIDIRQAKPLDRLSKEMALLLASGEMHPLRRTDAQTVRPKKNKIAQTSKARTVSASARRRSAQKAATELQQAFDAYRMESQGRTMKSFLQTDTASKLRNSRRKPWTYRSALRALRDIKDSSTPPQGDNSKRGSS